MINCRRFCNVLFLDLIRPKLVTLGKSLTSQELDVGLKKDKHLQNSIMEEYNRGMIGWLKSKDVFTQMKNEYDIWLKNRKQSGFHGNKIPT